MAAFLDSIVPARRREKRRIMALEERLHARWGDPAITAPLPGGWTDFPPEPEIVSTADNLILSSNCDQLDIDSQTSVKENASDAARHLASLQLTIPLPWYSNKKSHRRSTSLTHESAPFSNVSLDAARPVTQDTNMSPVAIIYKPASEEYRKELNAMAHSAHGSRSVSPAVLYKPASEEYKKALDQMAKPPTQRYPSSSSAPETLISNPEVSKEDEDGNDRPASHESRTEHLADLVSDNVEVPDDSNADMSTASSPSLSKTDTTSTATSPITDELVKGMADFGLSPSPALKQERFGRSSSYDADPQLRRMSHRKSASSSSSKESDRSSVLPSPIGLQNMTMSSGIGGGYYSSLEEEYRQIAKTVEDAAVVEYGRKYMRNSGQFTAGSGARARGGSLERPSTLAKGFPVPPRNLSRERHRDRSLDRISDIRDSERIQPTPGLPRTALPKATPKDINTNLLHYHDTSLGRISETQTPITATMATATAVVIPPRDVGRRRNMSADRALALSKDRRAGSRTRMGDRVRGKSVESSRSALRERGTSKERITVQFMSPQHLVPQAEDLWG